MRDVKEKFDSWALFDDIKERLPVHGVVEGVLDGSTVRVLLVPSFYSVVVRLAGVQSPIWTRAQGGGGGGAPDDGAVRTAQPWAEQAKYLTEYCLLGRDVALMLGGVNKDDTFYGTVLFGGKNVAEELLKNGYARFVQWSCPEQDVTRFMQLEQQAQAKVTCCVRVCVCVCVCVCLLVYSLYVCAFVRAGGWVAQGTAWCQQGHGL